MAKTSDQKSKVYGKYGREIYVCAKQGGVDPAGNLALRSMIDRAKKDQVPAHVIDKALDKAKGGGGEDYSITRYEGFGPGGCSVIVECLTDNPNRTFGDVRVCFTKSNSKLGVEGSVSHMFDHSAIFSFKGDEEASLEALVMADVDVSDIEEDEGMVTVFTPHTEFGKARAALIESLGNLEFDVEEIQYVPQTTAPVSEESMPDFEKLITMLEDLDDVQRVYHSAEV
jgi:YebC/PmpR family DNA-binding regulatory protein